MSRVVIEVSGDDGVFRALDVPDGVQVTLNFTSPLFGSVQDIRTSYSQTVTIPKTERNDALLSRLIYPQSDGFVEYMTVRVSSDGFPIIGNGRMVVTSASASGYAATILFGEIMEGLRAWIDAKPMLTDLTRYDDDFVIIDDSFGDYQWSTAYAGQFPDHPEMGIWGSEMKSKFDPEHYLSAYFVSACWVVNKDDGSRFSADYLRPTTFGRVVRPFVSFKEILTRIEIDNGLTFVFDSDIDASLKMTGIILGKRKPFSETYNTQFRIVDNLPDISQLDFVMGVCGYYGLHPTVTAEDEVTFVSFSDMYEGRNSAEDWSSKIISKNDFPKKAEFSFGDLKQTNVLTFAEGEGEIVPTPTDGGSFSTFNQSLEREGVISELPFSVAHPSGLTGIYHTLLPSSLYVGNNDEGVPLFEDNEFTPKIVEIAALLKNPEEDYRFTHTFYRISSYRLGDDYGSGWLGFEFMAYNPKVITENILITAYELKNFDWAKPVYLSKYGRYYAVYSIRWQTGGDLAEAKLVQMDEHWEIFNNNP